MWEYPKYRGLGVLDLASSCSQPLELWEELKPFGPLK